MTEQAISRGSQTQTDWAKPFRIAQIETWSGLAAFCGLVLVGLSGVFLVAGYQANGAISSRETLNPYVLAFLFGATGWFIFQYARLANLKDRQKAFRRHDLKRLCLTELFVWLFLSLLVLSFAAFCSKGDASFLDVGINLKSEWQRDVFFACLFAAFVPAADGVYNTERRLAETDRGGKLLRDDAISPGSLAFGVLAMGLIVLLAWAAGRHAFQSIGPDMGVIATLFIVFAFIFFIVISSVTRGLNIFSERKPMEPPVAAAGLGAAISPAKWASWIDSILVRLVAPLTGATQSPDGRHGLGWHHLYVIGVMTPLTALGYALPEPWGLVPIFMAFLFALAVGRRWAWVEGDREAAARLRTTKGRDIHVGFGNDLRDEAMLAYAFLFVLVPLTLYQLNEMTGAFQLKDGLERSQTFVDWIQFFGLELFKAVPLVDWAEIYGFKPEPNIVEVNPDTATIGKHLIFGARVLVDFVVMAALFQAISIVQRNRTQSKLYDSGQLDVLDPISEEDFFERGIETATQLEYDAWHRADTKTQLQNPVIKLSDNQYFRAKQKFANRVDLHVNNKVSAGTRWPYSKERLDELVTDHRDDVRAGARWMIARYGLLAGDPKTQINQLADRWLTINLPLASEAVAFNEKQNFEEVLKAARNRYSTISDNELGRLAFLLAQSLDRPEFSYAHILAFRLIGKMQSRCAVALIAASVMKRQDRTDHEDLGRALDEFSFSRERLRQGTDEMRVYAYEALEEMAAAPSPRKATLKLAVEFLTFMEPREAMKSKKAAQKVKRALLNALRKLQA